MKPTSEQTNCIDQFQTGKNLRINAYAGTGKTSTLKLLSRGTQRRGAYMAFNKSIADEARKGFPDTVMCSTTHSMAFRAMVPTYKDSFDKKMTGSINGGFVSFKMHLGTKDVAGFGVVKPRSWGFLMCETVKRFMRSGSKEIGTQHVPLEGKLATLEPKYIAPLKEAVTTDAIRLWSRMLDPRSDLPLSHDGYLKAWALRRPQIDADYILLDEAQDTNGVVLELMKHQNAQLIAVGDKHQQLYEWRGAQNAMVTLPAELEARLSTSFRFGQAIADNATEILELLGETLPLKGNPDKRSVIGPIQRPNAILCRTNSRLIECVMDTIDQGKRPHVVGGVDEILTFVDAAEKLMAGQSVEYPLEFFGFKDWAEVKMVTEMEEGAAELRRWVSIIERYGTDALRAKLTGLPKQEAGAHIIFSTGHKSKGREWERVCLEDDFLRGVPPKPPKDGEPIDNSNVDAELRLYYVAATRGQVHLYLHPSSEDRIDRLREQREDQKAKAA